MAKSCDFVPNIGEAERLHDLHAANYLLTISSEGSFREGASEDLGSKYQCDGNRDRHLLDTRLE